MEEVKIIELPKILDLRGNLSLFENNNQIPFDIKRIYWIYDVPGGEIRGGHAFKQQNEFIVVLSGSLDVVVFDGFKEKKFSLNRSYYGLFIPNGLWRHMENFATNSVALVVTNTSFDENDYIRDKDVFLKLKLDENVSI
jgi:dTDP-4-dehydrorhamnose 3,5-epimerase-like enzyme